MLLMEHSFSLAPRVQALNMSSSGLIDKQLLQAELRRRSSGGEDMEWAQTASVLSEDSSVNGTISHHSRVSSSSSLLSLGSLPYCPRSAPVSGAGARRRCVTPDSHIDVRVLDGSHPEFRIPAFDIDNISFHKNLSPQQGAPRDGEFMVTKSPRPHQIDSRRRRRRNRAVASMDFGTILDKLNEDDATS